MNFLCFRYGTNILDGQMVNKDNYVAIGKHLFEKLFLKMPEL